MSLIIGTAGHIDHGKTSLIQALNGFWGDKNQDEKDRGITIDLSFSNLQNGDKNISFIDVPGHENLVKTMISGAYGFSYCMVVVDANEGIMPQTKEHLEVLNLLGVCKIILVLTKCDLVAKERAKEQLKFAKDEIKNYPNLEIAASFETSIKDKDSFVPLKEFLFTLQSPQNSDSSEPFRYYIDRVFSIAGIGKVVTGSLLSGKIEQNERVLNLDLGKEFGVKSIEIHDQNAQIAYAPNRVALNLSGNGELKKGQILSKKGIWRGFFDVDCLYFGEISQNSDALFCVGTRQIRAKVKILKDFQTHKFINLKFDKEAFLLFDEKYILMEGGRVKGGGRVLNPVSEPLKKDEKIKLLSALLVKDFKATFEILIKNHKHGFGIISSRQRFNLSFQQALEIAQNLENVFVDSDALCIYGKSAIDDIVEIVKFIVSKNNFAIFSAQSIALKLPWASANLAKIALEKLEREKIIEQKDGIFIKFGVDLKNIFSNTEKNIYEILKSGKITPKAPYNIYDELDIDRKSGDDALKKLTKSKRVVRLAHNLFITADSLNFIIEKIKEIMAKKGKANVGILKDELQISRKFAIAYLEYVDKFSDIKKIGDDRFLLN